MKTEISSYEQQAIDFLNATGTAMKVKFLAYGFHFDDDKQSRDIFQITLVNKLHRFIFKFGQSINDSTGNGDNLPTAYDILSCLTKYDPCDFENFCSEFGYDIDSRKAFKTYKGVRREWKNIERLFTPKQIEQLQEIN